MIAFRDLKKWERKVISFFNRHPSITLSLVGIGIILFGIWLLGYAISSLTGIVFISNMIYSIESGSDQIITSSSSPAWVWYVFGDIMIWSFNIFDLVIKCMVGCAVYIIYRTYLKYKSENL